MGERLQHQEHQEQTLEQALEKYDDRNKHRRENKVERKKKQINKNVSTCILNYDLGTSFWCVWVTCVFIGRIKAFLFLLS